MAKEYIYEKFQIEEYMVKFIQDCFYKDFDNKGQEIKKEIIFLGDSIIRDYDLNLFFPNVKNKVFNCGVSGITTEGIYGVIKNGVVRHNPKGVVILVGTNDMSEQHNKRNEEIINNIANLVIQLKMLINNLNVVILSLIPCDEKRYGKDSMAGGFRENARIMEINKALKAFENYFKNLTFVDVYSSVVDKTNNLVNAYTHDGLHLNVKGYEKMTALIKPIVEKILKKD